MQPADRSASHGPLVRVRSILPRCGGGRAFERLRAVRTFRSERRSGRPELVMRVPRFTSVTEPHAALVACRLSSQRHSPGEKSERVDRYDRGLEPLQLATAGSIRDPASSISDDFGAGGLLRTPSLGPAPRTVGWAFAFALRNSVRGVDALSSFFRLGGTSLRIVSDPRSRHYRSEPTDFYDHEARELTFSDLRTCLCRAAKLSARKKSRSMRFCYPQRRAQPTHKLSTIRSQAVL